MIDLVSTRNVDEQTRASARLLAAVISQAVLDAATPFGTIAPQGKLIYESKIRKNLNPVARSAIRWLFFPDSTFKLYAHLIGLDAESIRRNLLDQRYADSRLLTTTQRRIIALRLVFERNDDGVFEENPDADDTGIQPEPEGSGGSESPGERGGDMESKGSKHRPRVPKGHRK